MSLLQKLRWPIAGLGLGAPANLAALSPAGRDRLARTLLIAFCLGVVAALLVLGMDRILFAGVSLERIRTATAVSLGQRLVIVLESAVMEEIVFRLGLSTLVASVSFVLLRRVTPRAAPISIWIGILIACLLFGLAHVGNLPNVPHPYLRAIVLNGAAGLILGWLYWYRGLEAAILAHLAADATLYLALPALLSR